MKKWWRSLGSRRRVLVGTVAGVFTVIVIAAIVGWGRVWFTSDATDSQAPPAPAESSQEAENPLTQQETAGSDSGPFAITYDANGMAEMPATTDPREAAAAAAAIAFSVDFSKLDRQQFLDTAIQRMTHPSDEYIGPEGQINTLIEARPFEETQFHSLPPEEVLKLQTIAWAQEKNPENFTWWTLANGSVYDDFTMLPDLFWKASPEQVLDEAEMEKIDPSVIPTFPEGADMDPDTAGASLTQWWILSDVENSKVGTTAATTLRPAHFAIWCDAPADGGLCGVAYTLNSSFPAVWPRQ